MTISLIEENSWAMTAIEDLAARMLKRSKLRAQRLDRGANSRVFVVQDVEDSRKYVMKFYFRHPSDPRDRLENEFSGLSFLRTQGITVIAHPVAVDRQESCAIYEFIEGKKIFPGDIAAEDIVYTVDFIADLKRLSLVARSHNIAFASEACFSFEAIIANINERLARLVKIDGQEQEHKELAFFLKDHFRPFLNVLVQWVWGRCAQKEMSFDSEIPWEERILSPSDFGFHNAVRGRNGRIVFLDFEYFGWDDPAKTISDFLLHPAMALREDFKKVFVQRMLEVFKENRTLIERLKAVYPLFGLKWCMIFLNEFVPEDFSRRVYAAGIPLEQSRIRKEQLLKAKNLYQKIKETYKVFPYL